jgi:hypothetical protein
MHSETLVENAAASGSCEKQTGCQIKLVRDSYKQRAVALLLLLLLAVMLLLLLRLLQLLLATAAAAAVSVRQCTWRAGYRKKAFSSQWRTVLAPTLSATCQHRAPVCACMHSV